MKIKNKEVKSGIWKRELFVYLIAKYADKTERTGGTA